MANSRKTRTKRQLSRLPKDLHEATTYTINSKEGDSKSWLPQRGLREGCSTSPVLFNVFHQMVIRVAENNRQAQTTTPVGIPWKYIEQDKIPGPNQFGKFNSECKETFLTMSLFADNTTILGTAEEMEVGCEAIKETNSFEEKKKRTKRRATHLWRGAFGWNQDAG